jgi:hypothetical protein
MKPPAASADSGGDWTVEIERLEDRAREAFLGRDIERLAGLWSDGLMVNSLIRLLLNGDQVSDLLQRGVIAHTSFAVHIENMTRRAETVVVMGYDVVVNTPGSSSVQRRFTNIWQAASGSCQMIARHANVAGASFAIRQ